MKTILKSLINLMILVLILGSCDESALEPLNGKYAPPEAYDFTVLASQSRVKDGALYVFTINLQDEGSNTLNLKLVDVDYILSASDFTPANEVSKKIYLVGSEGSMCNGQQITSGTISVDLEGSAYAMNGILYLADGTVVKMTSEFSFVYEPEPYVPIYTYTVETQSPAMGGAQGDQPIVGTIMHKITVYADDELNAYFEVVSDENASSFAGTYTIKDGLDAAGQMANGYYLDWAWWGGAGTMEGGSYYIAGGEKKFLREGEGAVTIVDNSGVLSINGSNLGILDMETLLSSNGATWQNLDQGGSITIADATLAGEGADTSIALSNLFAATATDNSQYGGSGYTITLKMATEGLSVTYNASTYGYDFTGDGHYISVDLLRDEATLTAGTYNVVSNASAVVGDCIAGYEDPYFGTGAIWGTAWGTVTDGSVSDIAVSGGTVDVALEGETYTITVNVTTDEGSVLASYSGSIAI